MKKLDFIFAGGLSKRYHTVDTLKTQDIASHSFGVAWLVELLSLGEASKELIMASLAHDLAEHRVGDIPSPAKRELGISKLFDLHEGKHLAKNGLDYALKLIPEEVRILRLADMMEGMLYCVRERTLGNRGIDIVYYRFSQYVRELAPVGIENSIFEYITEKWRNTHDSEYEASGRNALQVQVSTLGLGDPDKSPVPTGASDAILKTVEG